MQEDKKDLFSFWLFVGLLIVVLTILALFVFVQPGRAEGYTPAPDFYENGAPTWRVRECNYGWGMTMWVKRPYWHPPEECPQNYAPPVPSYGYYYPAPAFCSYYQYRTRRTVITSTWC